MCLSMDIFGTGARARVKALEEALSAERARTAELTRQLIAISDAKAYRVLVPSQVTKERGKLEPKAAITSPADTPNHANVVARARDSFRAPEANRFQA